MSNIVALTAREHFVCHWLLSKMTEGRHKCSMVLALSGMRRASKGQERYSTKITSRVYATIKGNLNFSDETKKKMSDSAKNRQRFPHTELTKNKISLSHQGKQKSVAHALHIKESKQNVSLETRQKISDSRLTIVVTDETKRKQSLQKSGANNPRYGKPVSEETRRKISESIKLRKLTS